MLIKLMLVNKSMICTMVNKMTSQLKDEFEIHGCKSNDLVLMMKRNRRANCKMLVGWVWRVRVSELSQLGSLNYRSFAVIWCGRWPSDRLHDGFPLAMR